MLYNIKKVVYLHCVFHGIRFKVNEDWVSAIDTLLFFYTFSSSRMAFHFFVRTKKRNKEKRRLRSGAKKSLHFPKRKELASLKQLFVLNGKYSIFLHTPPLRPEANEEYGKQITSTKRH